MTGSSAVARTPGRPVDALARLERSSRILAGARRCFVQNGFHKASIADIAAACGVSVANIYQYFASKDAMILALAEANLETDRQLISALAATKFEPVALRQVLETMFLTEDGLHSARMRKEIFSEASRNPAVAAVVRAADDASLAILSQSLAGSQREGLLPGDVDTGEAAQLLGYLFEGLLARYAVDPSSGPDLTDFLVRAMFQILRLSSH